MTYEEQPEMMLDYELVKLLWQYHRYRMRNLGAGIVDKKYKYPFYSKLACNQNFEDEIS